MREVGEILISKTQINYWEAEDDLERIPAGTEFIYHGEVEGNPNLLQAKIGTTILHVKKCKFVSKAVIDYVKEIEKED